jgi:leucyl-tRNA synthetase
VPEEEPFKKVIHQGMIIKDGGKMSKSKGNVVNPDDYGPDELRLGLMFIGPYFEGGVWNDSSIVGVRKFLGRLKRWISESIIDGERIDICTFKAKIDHNVKNFKFNLVVSDFMKFFNENKNKKICFDTKRDIENLIVCFCPGFLG